MGSTAARAPEMASLGRDAPGEDARGLAEEADGLRKARGPVRRPTGEGGRSGADPERRPRGAGGRAPTHPHAHGRHPAPAVPGDGGREARACGVDRRARIGVRPRPARRLRGGGLTMAEAGDEEQRERTAGYDGWWRCETLADVEEREARRRADTILVADKPGR